MRSLCHNQGRRHGEAAVLRHHIQHLLRGLRALHRGNHKVPGPCLHRLGNRLLQDGVRAGVRVCAGGRQGGGQDTRKEDKRSGPGTMVGTTLP